MCRTSPVTMKSLFAAEAHSSLSGGSANTVADQARLYGASSADPAVGSAAFRPGTGQSPQMPVLVSGHRDPPHDEDLELGSVYRNIVQQSLFQPVKGNRTGQQISNHTTSLRFYTLIPLRDSIPASGAIV
jgi:hypothetical protein